MGGCPRPPSRLRHTGKLALSLPTLGRCTPCCGEGTRIYE
nr:MAG TPA: hypothetical protein [Caudoviricetes sp.]